MSTRIPEKQSSVSLEQCSNIPQCGRTSILQRLAVMDSRLHGNDSGGGNDEEGNTLWGQTSQSRSGPLEA